MIGKLKRINSNPLIKKWGFLVGGLVSNQMLLFILQLFASRKLSVDEFGYLNLFMVLTSIGSIIVQLGLLQVITREIARENRILQKIIKLTSPYFIIICFLVLIGLYVYLFYFEELKLIDFWVLISVLTIFMFLWNYLDAVFFGLNIYKYSYYINILAPIPIYILLIISSYFYSTLTGILFVTNIYFFVKIITYFSFFIRYWKNAGVSVNSLDKNSILKGAAKIFTIQVLSIPVAYLPTVFLSLNNTKTEVGIYSASNKISLALNLIITSLNQIIYPRLAYSFNKNKDNFKIETKNIFNFVFLGGFLFTIFTSIYSREFILFIWGNKFNDTVRVFLIQSWVTFLILVHTIIGTIAFAGDFEKKIVKYSVQNALLVFIISFIFSYFNSFVMTIFIGINFVLSLILHINSITKGNLILNQNKRILILLLIMFIIVPINYLLLNYSFIFRTSIFIIELTILITYLKKELTEIILQIRERELFIA